VAGKVEAGDEAALANYRSEAPHARDAHPTDEHFLPLHVAYGAAGKGARGETLHRSFTLGNLSMAAYAFA
jgi:4,5-DOPA dioxygenase extradiol